MYSCMSYDRDLAEACVDIGYMYMYSQGQVVGHGTIAYV